MNLLEYIIKQIRKKVYRNSKNKDLNELARLCIKRKFDDGLLWLIQNQPDELDFDYLEGEAFDLIRDNRYNTFQVLQEAKVVNDENYIKFIHYAAIKSIEITKLLLEHPVSDPGKMYITIQESITMAEISNRETTEILRKYLKETFSK